MILDTQEKIKALVEWMLTEGGFSDTLDAVEFIFDVMDDETLDFIVNKTKQEVKHLLDTL